MTCNVTFNSLFFLSVLLFRLILTPIIRWLVQLIYINWAWNWTMLVSLDDRYLTWSKRFKIHLNHLIVYVSFQLCTNTLAGFFIAIWFDWKYHCKAIIQTGNISSASRITNSARLNFCSPLEIVNLFCFFVFQPDFNRQHVGALTWRWQGSLSACSPFSTIFTLWTQSTGVLCRIQSEQPYF